MSIKWFLRNFGNPMKHRERQTTPQTNQRRSTSSNRREILRRCNFHLARREIIEFFEMSNREAHAKDGQYVYKSEFLDGWKEFADNPCRDTAEQLLEKSPEYASFISAYFEGCCPRGIYHRRGIVTAINFPVGEYRLDMRLEEMQGLRELTAEEYAVFGRESLRDVIYHVKPTEFAGRHWKMMVGTTEGKLYQLGAILEMKAEEFTTNLPRDVFNRCEQLLGTPSAEEKGRFIWDTSTGTVTFQYAIIGEIFEADLYVGNWGTHR